MTLLRKNQYDQLSQRRIDELLASAESSFKAAFLELITHLADSIDVAEVARIMETGDIGQAILSTEKLALGMAGAWAELYTEGGQLSSSFIQQSVGLPIRFDITNSRAVAAMQGSRLRLIREVSDPQRLVFRDILADGIRLGLNPRDVARDLRSSLGLTQYQMQVVENYRSLLERGSSQALDRQLRDARYDGTVQRAADGIKPLSGKQIDTMVDRYRQRWVNFRAETIARTEGLRAASMGIQAGFEQAVQSGDLRREEIQRTWITRHDGRERAWHDTIHGQKRGLNEPFTSGLGNQLLEPRDPSAPAEDTVNCRCRVTYRLA